MNYTRQIRGPYVSYRPIGEFGASTIVKLKSLIADDLKDTSLDFAVDLTKMTTIDMTGIRFFVNLRKALIKEQREMVFFGGGSELQETIQVDEEPFKMFDSMEDFEQGFHEMSVEDYDNYFRLSRGKGPIRHLDLVCPCCGHESVKGFILDRKKHTLTWEDEQITPYYDYEDSSNWIDWDAYAVNVCPECLFASTRPDYFHMQVEEGLIKSILKEDDIDRIKNNIAQRKEVLQYSEHVHDGNFWCMTREKPASMISWVLNEMTLRHIAKDRNHIDSFEIANSNFMACKFSREEEFITKSLNTSMAWLSGIVKERERYSTIRIAMSYTFLVSLFLFEGKLAEARKILEEFSRDFSGEDWARFWLLRAKELYNNELEG